MAVLLFLGGFSSDFFPFAGDLESSGAGIASGSMFILGFFLGEMVLDIGLLVPVGTSPEMKLIAGSLGDERGNVVVESVDTDTGEVEEGSIGD